MNMTSFQTHIQTSQAKAPTTLFKAVVIAAHQFFISLILSTIMVVISIALGQGVSFLLVLGLGNLIFCSFMVAKTVYMNREHWQK